ncbi:MAG: helicase-related protein, partial [Candidatus Omnitrophica bacterium]|nr:helicase-related protein [Candidatus Omnitrophota bacterium]
PIFIASYAALLAAKSGYQSAIMVPTEVLAQQQYLKIAEIMCNFDVDVGILVGGMDRSGQEEVKNSILAGSIKVVIGTHALLEENIKFKNLGLVIIDEQHKFGVKQRDSLKQKGKVPDYLIMTATPIPRTLALTIFGDMDISTIKETPFGPKSINTYWVTEERRSQVYRFLKESVDNGAQGFVVCPRIEDNSDSEIKNVQRIYLETAGLLGENKVALLHGRMSSEQKKNILSDFKKGKVSVLVSTVVIEVGIDVPDASIMIIEDASRFGLSQLHQLRGRIGRAGQESFCILISSPSNKDAVMRLESMVSTLDGFKISEDDLQIRGAGELMGLKQHGFYGMRLQNIVSQVDLLSDARQDAFSILNHDPHLSSESNKAIKLEIKSRFPVLSGIK